MSANHFVKQIDKVKHLFTHPEVYLGDEPGTFHRDWDSAKLRICVVAGSTYENLTGNMAQPLLVRLLGEHREDIVIERAFFPNSKDDLAIFEKYGFPIFSLESKRRLSEFDVVMFSCSFQGLDLNAIKMMHMSGIPPRRPDRYTGKKYPLIMRGGQNDANPCPFMLFYDIMWVGDAEAALRELVDKLIDIKSVEAEEEDWRTTAKEYALGHAGCLIPEFYKSHYGDDGVFTHWETLHPKAKVPVLAARMTDMRTFIYKTPITNYLESMGSGEMLVSRGCIATCSFCLEGNKERPYRELPDDDVVKSLLHSMKESGVEKVTLSAYCFSSYLHSKEMIKRLVEEVTPSISLTSQRVDEAAADPVLMRMSAAAGNRSISLGVEGVSERLRALVVKGATEDQIIKAVENCALGGYNKVKLFMISNIPTENDEDREELVRTAIRIKTEVLDKYPSKKLKVRFSWTDLSIQPHTPFQWLKPTAGGRHLSPFLKRIQEQGIRVSFGSGKGSVIDTVLQWLHLADDRISEMLVPLVLEDGVLYFRQIPKKSLDCVNERLAKEGLSLDTWFWDKEFTTPLPWYVVSYGRRPESLWKQFREGMDGTARQPDLGKRIQTYYGKKGAFEEPKPMSLAGTNQHLIVKFNINETHRFINANALRQLMRRALYKNDIPMTRTIEVATDSVREDDWVYGVDYASARLMKRLIDPPMFDSFTPVFNITGTSLMDSSAAKIFGNLFAHTRILIAHPVKDIEKKLAAFMEQPKVLPGKATLTGSNPAVVLVKVMGQFGPETEVIYARPLVKQMQVKRTATGFYLDVIHHGSLSIYDLYAKFSGARKTAVLAQVAERLDLYTEQPELGASDCQKCGLSTWFNPFGEEICSACGDLRVLSTVS